MAPSRSPVYDLAAIVSLLRPFRLGDELAAFGAPPSGVPGFLTFFDPGWSLLTLRAAVGSYQRIFRPQPAPPRRLLEATAAPAYRRVRMDALPESSCKAFGEQSGLLGPGEGVPTTRTLVLGILLHFLATGERLFLDGWVRTADVTGPGRHACVGDFLEDGLVLFDELDGGCSPDVGLAVALA